MHEQLLQIIYTHSREENILWQKICWKKYFTSFHPVISLSELFLKCIYVTFSFGFSASFSFNFSFSLISNSDEHTRRIMSLKQ